MATIGAVPKPKLSAPKIAALITGVIVIYFTDQLAACAIITGIIGMLALAGEVFLDCIPVSLRDDFSTLIDLSLADLKIRPIV